MGKRSTPSRLRVARAMRAVSVRELVEACGGVRGRMFFYRLERGECARLTPEIAEIISARLQIPVSRLFPQLKGGA